MFLRATFIAAAIGMAAIGSASSGSAVPRCYENSSGTCVEDPTTMPAAALPPIASAPAPTSTVTVQAPPPAPTSTVTVQATPPPNDPDVVPPTTDPRDKEFLLRLTDAGITYDSDTRMVVTSAKSVCLNFDHGWTYGQMVCAGSAQRARRDIAGPQHRLRRGGRADVVPALREYVA
jgi:hypothetical protein